MSQLKEILSARDKPALLIGNGINRFSGQTDASWDDLLKQLANERGLHLSGADLSTMSNTEFFDILDLKAPAHDRTNLQKEFRDKLKTWQPASHHTTIVNWAERHARPIITVNFDENLSRSIGADFYRDADGFTDYYPWSSYFSDQEISDVRSSFAIWHAHGMERYFRSIRLGLTHYMGSVDRARAHLYKKNGLLAAANNSHSDWTGSDTWLEAFFFCPIVMIGFGFGKDETFFRWLFLERARIHKRQPKWRRDTWFIDVQHENTKSRSAFLTGLGIQSISLPDYQSLYKSSAWQ